MSEGERERAYERHSRKGGGRESRRESAIGTESTRERMVQVKQSKQTGMKRECVVGVRLRVCAGA